MTTSATDIRRDLEQQGFARTGDIGGQPKTKYWTPDGRVMLVAPSWHEFVQRDRNGKVITSGIRDVNLDRGWLMQKPEILKPYCPHCDMWHDTLKEVAACQVKRQSLIKHATARMQEQGQPQENNIRMAKLEKEMGEIKGILTQLLVQKAGGK